MFHERPEYWYGRGVRSGYRTHWHRTSTHSHSHRVSPFEAWRFLTEDGGSVLGYQSQTFEGFYSWDVLTTAYAENEWSHVQPWNSPNSKTLQGGESITFGLRFL
jgi:hypothetical protein